MSLYEEVRGTYGVHVTKRLGSIGNKAQMIKEALIRKGVTGRQKISPKFWIKHRKDFIDLHLAEFIKLEIIDSVDGIEVFMEKGMAMWPKNKKSHLLEQVTK